MGTKTTVGIATARIFEDAEPGQPYSSRLIKDVLQKDDIPEGIIRWYGGTFKNNIEKFYTYGRDHFIYGLPRGQDIKTNVVIGNDDIADIIQSIEGKAVTILSSDTSSAASAEVAALEFMHWHRKLDPETLTIDSRTIELASDVIATFADAEFEEDDMLSITYDLSGTGSGTHTEIVEMRYYTEEQPVKHINYSIDEEANPNRTYWWIYYFDSEEFKDNYVNDPYDTNTLEYYPIAPIRLNKNYVHEERKGGGVLPTHYLPNIKLVKSELSDRNRSTRSLVNQLGLDLKTLADAIAESPDEKYVDDAYLMAIVPLKTEDQGDLEFLYKYFMFLHNQNPDSKTKWDTWLTNNSRNSPFVEAVIKDTSSPRKELQHTLSWNYMEVTSHGGSLIPIGTYSVFRVTGTKSKKKGYHYRTDNYYLRYQVDANNYIQIKINGIRKYAQIYTSTTKNKVKYAETTLADAYDANDPVDGLFVPLCRNVILDMDPDIADTTARRSIHLVINTIVKQKIKWYQTGIFKAILLIIAVVVSVYTANPGTFATVYSALAYIVINIAVGLAISYVIDLVLMDFFRWLADTLGEEFTLILAVVIAVIAITYGDGDTALQFADEMLLASTSLMRAINLNTLDDFAKLKSEMEEFFEDVEEVQEELEKAEDLLSTNLDALELVQRVPNLLEMETPNTFYYRTVHLGNPGVLCLDMAENYVDSVLNLPHPKI